MISAKILLVSSFLGLWINLSRARFAGNYRPLINALFNSLCILISSWELLFC